MVVEEASLTLQHSSKITGHFALNFVTLTLGGRNNLSLKNLVLLLALKFDSTIISQILWAFNWVNIGSSVATYWVFGQLYEFLCRAKSGL